MFQPVLSGKLEAVVGVLASKGAGNAGSTPGPPACAASTGVRFPRTSLTCHSEDFGCTKSDRVYAPQRQTVRAASAGVRVPRTRLARHEEGLYVAKDQWSSGSAGLARPGKRAPSACPAVPLDHWSLATHKSPVRCSRGRRVCALRWPSPYRDGWGWWPAGSYSVALSPTQKSNARLVTFRFFRL